MDSPHPSTTGSKTLLNTTVGGKESSPTSEKGRRIFSLRRRTWIAVILATVLVVLLAVLLPVGLLVIRDGGGNGEGASSGNPFSPSGATTGGDGSVIVTENGTQFTYSNSFGGFWVYDPDDPFNDSAQPNSWTPPLNQSWNFSTDHIYGVNLGGLFVLEPFISPSLFQKYPGSADEYTLSQLMRADNASGGISQIEEHYQTFITEQDIAEIAGAGLNWLRIPIGFWAIETWDNEPFLEGTSWTYFLKVLGWARKYGLRVCLDLHAIPGSQNGYNHSGRLSPVNFLNGNMGIANAERAMYYIRVLTEFISQPEYRNLVQIFGIVNEPLLGIIGFDQLTSFYLQAHNMIREITGYGEGNGPYIAIHDGFQALTIWDNFLQGSDRIILDQHPYFSFGGPQMDPIGVPGPNGEPGGIWPRQACDAWGPGTNDSSRNFGIVISGEFAASPNDCGLFLRNVNATSDNPECPIYDDWRNYNSTMKEGIMNFALASLDSFQNWFFWTWKIGPSLESGEIETPLWSYQLGLREGWLPRDPRQFVGKCASLGAAQNPFDGTYQPYMTGGVSSNAIPASATASFPWPPPTISGVSVPMSILPTYTATASIITMPPPTSTGTGSSVDGWFNDADTAAGVTEVAGCTYPDQYNGIFTVTPAAPCTGPT